ncbi:unnamed protein product [Linum tenue]|uniref:Uncharacterized protein n=1 Tax=Linum tenue TaxID=586396 RepID=A0AAV0HB65_9ROSI|nr:unnamed protein product [Linum tenue]
MLWSAPTSMEYRALRPV